MRNIRLSHEKAVNNLKNSAPDVEILGKFTGAKNPIEVRCKKCGKIWSPKYRALRAGIQCADCGGTRRLAHSEFIDRATKAAPFVEVLGTYVNSATKVLCRCMVCGDTWLANPSYFLTSHTECPACLGIKAVPGLNSMWDTRPDIARMLKDKSVGFGITRGSNEKVPFVCPVCGADCMMSPHSVLTNGITCKACGDGIGYPNKFIFNVLKQMGILFQTEKKFLWSSNRRYDFFIPSTQTIIEVHGMQHYVNSSGVFRRSLEEEQSNDLFKQEMALKNGIENYIVIDARYSNADWISRHILQSDLSKFSSIINVNFDECDAFSEKSLVVSACQLWDSGMSKKEIVKELSLSITTVYSLLKKGSKSGLCLKDIYEPKTKKIVVKMDKYLHNQKKVICLNTGVIYNSITEAATICNTGTGNISAACIGYKKSAGKDPLTGENLHWMHLKTYEEANQKQNAS